MRKWILVEYNDCLIDGAETTGLTMSQRLKIESKLLEKYPQEGYNIFGSSDENDGELIYNGKEYKF